MIGNSSFPVKHSSGKPSLSRAASPPPPDRPSFDPAPSPRPAPPSPRRQCTGGRRRLNPDKKAQPPRRGAPGSGPDGRAAGERRESRVGFRQSEGRVHSRCRDRPRPSAPRADPASTLSPSPERTSGAGSGPLSGQFLVSPRPSRHRARVPRNPTGVRRPNPPLLRGTENHRERAEDDPATASLTRPPKPLTQGLLPSLTPPSTRPRL